MSTHVFTVVVECDSSEEYDDAVLALMNVGEITGEESDYES